MELLLLVLIFIALIVTASSSSQSDSDANLQEQLENLSGQIQQIDDNHAHVLGLKAQLESIVVTVRDIKDSQSQVSSSLNLLRSDMQSKQASDEKIANLIQEKDEQIKQLNKCVNDSDENLDLLQQEIEKYFPNELKTLIEKYDGIQEKIAQLQTQEDSQVDQKEVDKKLVSFQNNHRISL